MKISYIFQLISQLFIVTIGKLLFLYAIKREGHQTIPNLTRRTGCIFVANHRHYLDPFLISASLPYRTCLKIAPVGFMLTNMFYDSWLRPFFWLGGCYPARNPNGKHKIFGVDGSVRLLKKSQSIFIFPEGKRIIKNKEGEVHSGVVRIHQTAPEAPMVLCHIEYPQGFTSYFQKDSIQINLRYEPKPAYSKPEQIMKVIYKL